MLTDSQLKSLKPGDKAYKVADALGLYVTVATTGTKAFRYDYRFDGKRATLTIGRYEDGTPSRPAQELNDLDFGGVVSLADARALREGGQVLKAVSSASSPISKPWRRYALRQRIFATRSGVLCHRTRAS